MEQEEKTTVQINTNLLKKLNKYCEQNGKVQYYVVEEAIKKYLEKQKKGDAK